MHPILAINANSINLFILERVLKNAGLTDSFITSSNGKKALKYYENLDYSNPDLFYPKFIFLDLNMPVMDGWEFLDNFVTTYLPLLNQTKVVITTSSVNPEDMARARKYPCVIDFVSSHLTVNHIKRILLT